MIECNNALWKPEIIKSHSILAVWCACPSKFGVVMLQVNDASKWRRHSTVIWPRTSEGFLYIDVTQIYLWLLLISPKYFNFNPKYVNEIYCKYELNLIKTCYWFHCDTAYLWIHYTCGWIRWMEKAPKLG